MKTIKHTNKSGCTGLHYRTIILKKIHDGAANPAATLYTIFREGIVVRTGYFPLLPSSSATIHRALLAVTAALAVSAGTSSTVRSDEAGNPQDVRETAPEPWGNQPTPSPAQADDPFVVPYMAAEAMPGFAGMPTPLVIVVSPPIKTGANPASETYVRIARLPPNATLSHGRSLGNGAWRVALDELPNLAITLPADQVGTTRLTITAVSEHGNGQVGQRTIDLDVPMRAPKATTAAIPRHDVEVASSVNQTTSSVTTEALALRSVATGAPPTQEPKPAAPPTAQAVVAFAVPDPPPNSQSNSQPTPPDGAPSPADAQKFLKRGNDLFARGDLAGARLFYRRAASAGSAQAALALGRTFDPLVLERMHVRGLAPDPEQAVRWYGEAVAKGVGEADGPLKELTGWFATHRK